MTPSWGVGGVLLIFGRLVSLLFYGLFRWKRIGSCIKGEIIEGYVEFSAF